jgi:hypothetical protein
MKRLLLFSLCAIGVILTPRVSAQSCTTATCAASSCSEANVLAALPSNSNTNAAVTVSIPACSATTWTTGFSYTPPSAVTNLTVIGSGSPQSGSGSTGAASSCTATDLVDNYGSGPMMQFNPSYGQTVRVSCMIIDPNSTSTSLYDPLYFIGTCTSSGCPQIRVDNINFGHNTPWSEGGNSSNAEAAVLAEMVFGVLDHNTLCTSATPCSANTGWELFNAEQGTYLGTGQYGDNSWYQPDSLGGANNLFAENNLRYTNGYLSWNDCEQQDSFANRGGCRFVIRYNTDTVTGTSGGFGISQNHGTDSGGRARGGRNAEVYNNTMACDVSSGGCSGLEGGLRSGAGMYYGNSFTFSPSSAAGSSSALGLAIYRAEGSWDSNSFAYCGGGGNYDDNDGTVYFSGTMTTGGTGVLTMTDGSKSFGNLVPSGAPYSVYDSTLGFYSEVASNTSTTITIHAYLASSGAISWGGSCNTTSGANCGFNNGDSYQVLRATVCADQPARGQSSVLLSGTTPTPTGWVGNAIDPIYRWNETFSTTPSVPNIYSSVSGRLIAYRDWYDQASGIQTTSSSPFSCNGSTGGTGWGTTANRPSSCSGACSAHSLGCGYYETDANTLYVWESGAWVSYYTPYTYPHPLDSSGALPPAPFPTILAGQIKQSGGVTR